MDSVTVQNLITGIPENMKLCERWRLEVLPYVEQLCLLSSEEAIKDMKMGAN
jgi:hypothetical protein